nr:DMT family transporter [bacterium]
MRRGWVWLALVGAVIGGAISGPLVRLTLQLPEAPSPVLIAFVRQAIAAACCIALVCARPAWRRQITSASGKDWLAMSLSGILMAANFVTWNIASGTTTAFSASLFLSTQSIFCTLGGLLLKEKPAKGWLIGALLALLGGVVISLGGDSSGVHSLYGDLMALLTALALAGYMMCGRVVRTHMQLIPYTAVVYTICTVVLAACLPFMPGPAAPLSPKFFLLVGAMVVLCTFGSHSLTNLALGYLPTWQVGMAVLGEPIMAAGWAFLFFGQVPPALAWLGGAMILIGLAWALVPRKKASPDGTPAAAE